jgi:hypothetical protein
LLKTKIVFKLVYDCWPAANFEASWIMCDSLTHNDKLRTPFFIFVVYLTMLRVTEFLKGTTLLVGRSRNRSTVVSQGIFSVTSDSSMCQGSIQPLKNKYQDTPGVKTAGA